MKGVEYTSARAPVVRGQWSEKQWTTDYGCGVIKHRAIVCSACKGEIADGEYTHYCPNCGAKMDGERRDDEGCPSFVRAIPITWIDKKITGYASQLRSHELDSLVTVKNMWEKDLES